MDYLGHRIDAEGLHAHPDKVAAKDGTPFFGPRIARSGLWSVNEPNVCLNDLNANDMGFSDPSGRTCDITTPIPYPEASPARVSDSFG